MQVCSGKTCSNSLRVNFVNEIFPEAKYIFLVRNGIDVVASMKKRWKTKFEPLFIFKKALYTPITDMPYYTIKYLYNRLYKIFSKENWLIISVCFQY